MMREAYIRGLVLLLFFGLVFLWMAGPGSYVLLANQDRGLFFMTRGHLQGFLDRPGGLLEYLGHFLTQFYRFRLWGSLCVSLVLVLNWAALNILLRGLPKERTGTGFCWIAALILPAILLGMQAHYPHQLYHSLGFSAAAIFAAWLNGAARRSWLVLLSVPLAFIVVGGYIWVAATWALAAQVTGRQWKAMWPVAGGLVLVVLTAFLWQAFLSHFTMGTLLLAALPVGLAYALPFLPLLLVGGVTALILLPGLEAVGRLLAYRLSPWIAFALVLFFGSGLVKMHYSPDNRAFFRLEAFAVEEDWEDLLLYARAHPSRNLFGTCYTNLALAHTGRLCTDLFLYPQAFGPGGLAPGWDAKEEILKRGGDYFQALGLVNEAQHWAFESMIVEGFTRRNLLRLIETELVRENDEVVEKYLHLLDHSLFDRDLAAYYSALLKEGMTVPGKTGRSGTGHVFRGADFFVDGLDARRNLEMLIDADPLNRIALDYLMAIHLLNKDSEAIAALSSRYTHGLPVLVEEALLVHHLVNRREAPPEGLISPATQQRFQAYFSVLRQASGPDEAAARLREDYGHTFWYHMNFHKASQ